MAENIGLSNKKLTKAERLLLQEEYDIPFKDDYDYLQHFAPPRSQEISYFIPADIDPNDESLITNYEQMNDVDFEECPEEIICLPTNEDKDCEFDEFMNKFVEAKKRNFENQKQKEHQSYAVNSVLDEEFDLLMKTYEGNPKNCSINPIEPLNIDEKVDITNYGVSCDEDKDKYEPMPILDIDIKSKILNSLNQAESDSGLEDDEENEECIEPIIIPDTPRIVDKSQPKQVIRPSYTPSVISFASTLKRSKPSSKGLRIAGETQSIASSQMASDISSTYTRLSMRSKCEDKETKTQRKQELKLFRSTRRMIKSENRAAFVKENETQKKIHNNNLVTKNIRPL